MITPHTNSAHLMDPSIFVPSPEPRPRHGIAWAATRHGEWVGWGTSPDAAAESAALMGMSRCEVEPVPFDMYGAILRCLSTRSWRTERELLELTLAAALEGMTIGGLGSLGDMDDESLLTYIDTLEAELAALDSPPLPLSPRELTR